MAVVEFISDRRRNISSFASSSLRSWGNWYILRTAHEFGWASHYACLNYFGLFVNEHKILFDTPKHVRLVDVAVGRLHELLRQALALDYWWHRHLTGDEVTDRERAYAMGLKSPRQFDDFRRVAEKLAEYEIERLDVARKNARVE